MTQLNRITLADATGDSSQEQSFLRGTPGLQIDSAAPMKRLAAREWIKQTGETATEMFAELGPEIYSEIMIEILEAALRQSGCYCDLCAYEWHEMARAAIAKAKGQQ